MLNAVLTLTGLAALCGIGLGAAGRRLASQRDPVVDRIEEVLPQTQCGQCGYPGCRPYAEAVASGEASIELCTPGGNATVRALADLLQVEAEPGQEAPKGPQVAFIDESQCVGCTRCLPACPVDAIVGAQRQVHTVIADECTGCELCVQACPVDCITMVPAEEPLSARVRPLPTPQAVQEAPERRPGPLRHPEVQPARGGGVIIPDAKDLTRDEPVREAPLPEALTIPLLDHTGAELSPRVAAGARVGRGDRITDAPADKPGVPLHAPTSGTVAGVERRPLVHAAEGTVPCLVLRPDGADTAGALLPRIEAPASADPERLIERIREAGVRGMGGATFPTALKIADARRTGVDTLVVNAVECDTYLTCDETVLRHHAEAVIAGAQIAARAAGAERILMAIKDSAEEALEAAQAAIDGSGADIRIVQMAAHYPAGNERHIVYPATGRTVPPGARPPAVGVLCQNVSTLLAVEQAVRHGEPSVTRLVTLTGGGVAEPGNYWIRIGTPLGDLIDAEASAGCRILVGGGIMGTPVTDLSVPLMQGVNGVVVEAPEEAPLPEQPCIGCNRCTEVCPEGLSPREMASRVRAGLDVGEAADAVELDPMRCTSCASCELVCPSSIPLSGIVGHAKDTIRARMRERERAERARARYEARQAREERRRREKEAARKRKREAIHSEVGKHKPSAATEG